TRGRGVVLRTRPAQPFAGHAGVAQEARGAREAGVVGAASARPRRMRAATIGEQLSVRAGALGEGAPARFALGISQDSRQDPAGYRPAPSRSSPASWM